MMRFWRKVVLGGLLATLTTLAGAQTLNVTSPNNGDFLGQSNELNFTINGVNVEVTMLVTVIAPSGGTTNIEERFTPDADGKISDNIALNFSQSAPQGSYSIEVRARRNDTQVIFGSTTIAVQVDTIRPKFLQFNPISNSFVRGIVPIRVDILEPNFRDYRVQINNQDIPNNSGSTLTGGSFTVDWDTSGIINDGAQSINIRLRDLADNEENRNLSVTLDRVAPVVNVVQPRANISLSPRSNVSIAVDINDSSPSSVDVTGVDIVARTLDGQYLARPSRVSFRNTSGNILRWAGSLRYRRGLPKEFKLVINVIDRAGNVAATQEVRVRYR